MEMSFIHYLPELLDILGLAIKLFLVLAIKFGII